MFKYKEASLLGQHLIPHPGKTLFWREEQLLIVADPHFGKTQIFRENGIPIPGGTTARDLEWLSCRMDQLQPRKLLFLGDLIHGRIENQTNLNHLVDKWRRRHKNVELFLATGNHDLRSGDPPHQFQFDHVAKEIIIGSFVFKHKPTFDGLFYGFAGHLHPAVTITGKGGLKETLSCFCFGPQGALLPAFGSFTGNQVIRPTSEDRIYVVAGDEVVEMLNGVSLWWVLSNDYSAISVSTGVLVLIVWLSTFVLQVPIHNRLKAGKEDREIRHLVATNWIRTAAWSLKAGVVSIDTLSSTF